MTSPAISGQKENGKQDSTSDTAASNEEANATSRDQQQPGTSPLVALKRLLRFANMLTSQGC